MFIHQSNNKLLKHDTNTQFLTILTFMHDMYT